MLAVVAGIALKPLDEEKPQKYPVAFANADLLIISKNDLTPHVEFDLERCLGLAREIKPSLRSLVTSAKTGEGLERASELLLGLWG